MGENRYSVSLKEYRSNIEELRRRCRMTFKIHYNAEEVFSTLLHSLAALSAVGLAVLNTPLGNKQATRGAVTTFWAAAAATVEYVKPFDWGPKHHAAAVEYAALERDARQLELVINFMTDRCSSGATEEDHAEVKAATKILWSRKAQLDKESPVAHEVMKWYTAPQLKGKKLDD
jgi:hypothetical protein